MDRTEGFPNAGLRCDGRTHAIHSHDALPQSSVNDNILIDALSRAAIADIPRSQAIERIAVSISRCLFACPSFLHGHTSVQINSQGTAANWFAYFIDRQAFFDQKIAEAVNEYFENIRVAAPERDKQHAQEVVTDLSLYQPIMFTEFAL